MYSVIKPRGDIKSNWEKINPILREREWGIEWEHTIGVGNVKVKIGDGIKNWNDLDYAIVGNVEESVIKNFATLSDSEENPELQANSSLDLLFAQIKRKFDYVISGQNKQPKQIIPITLTASGWTGSIAPYTQTVIVDGLTEGDNPLLVRMLEDGATETEQKAYNKAFGIISEGTGLTNDSTATFKVYKKPATDITIGLNGVIGGIHSDDNNVSTEMLIDEGVALEYHDEKYCVTENRYYRYGNVVTIILDISKNPDIDDNYIDGNLIFEPIKHSIGFLSPEIYPINDEILYFTCSARTGMADVANRLANAAIWCGEVVIDNENNSDVNDVAGFLICFTYICRPPSNPSIDCNSNEVECIDSIVECDPDLPADLTGDLVEL